MAAQLIRGEERISRKRRLCRRFRPHTPWADLRVRRFFAFRRARDKSSAFQQKNRAPSHDGSRSLYSGSIVVVAVTAAPAAATAGGTLAVLTDAGKTDYKLISVVDCDPRYDDYNDLDELPNFVLKEIRNFFDNYKILQKVEEWAPAEPVHLDKQ